jgi:hypothetical protein
VTLVVVAAACGSSDREVVAGPGDLGHIHDLVVDDGTVLVASHTGLYRIEGLDRAVLVGTEHHDLMSMTMDGSELLASGHPDLRFDEYRVEDRPPFLGLARSRDGGESWEVVDLLGDADFHALVPVDDGLYGAETSGRIWHLDADGAWVELGEVEARDLAVDPTDPSRQLAPDYDGVVRVSSDGAETWSVLDGSPTLLEIEWPASEVVLGVEQDGTIWAASSPELAWDRVAAGPAEVETFSVDHAGVWWVTVHGGAISRSDDQGTTWDDVYVPPTRP